MQFKRPDGPISFQEFSSYFEEEANILTEIQEEEITFIISEHHKLSLSFESYNPISIEIEQVLKKHEIFFYKNSLYKDPLAKAIGLKKGKEKPIVLDTTAGMLGDSLLMYSYGLKKLVCCERNPVVATLIVNALKVANSDIEFIYGSALDHFTSGKIEKSNIDVIFYDPMYQEKNSKTAPKKEMAIFREIVGVDQDIFETAKTLKSFAKERLVIKRSNKAKPILEMPSHTIKAKSTSYDVYLSHK